MVKLPKRFNVGERIFAKVRGYPPWPAKIQNITDPNTKHAKYHVVFYGTKEIGTCKIEDLFQYADNKDKFSKQVRRKYFHEGIQELEEDLKKYPNPVSGESSRDSESAENVPENAAEDASEKEADAVASADDGEAGNLIIDEGDKKKTAKRKSQVIQTPEVPEKKKRGRKSMATILAENQTPKQDAPHDSQDEDTEKNVVSRSGRKIKPKRFHDFDGAELPIDSSRNDQSIRSRTKSKNEESNENQETPIASSKKRMSVESKADDGGGDGGVSSAEDALLLVGESASVQEARASPGYAGRLLVARTRAGLPVGIKLDVNRPDRFESEAARARWDLSVTRNAMRLKEQLESGDIAPEIIKDSLDFNVHVPEDDRRSHAKDEAEIQNQLRLRTLRTESQIMFLDSQIRSSLGLDQANVDECLESMDQILELQIVPLMLKKHPHIVETIKRLRRYVGNLSDWKLSEEETIVFKQKADEIKKKAEVIYNKFKTLFSIPEDQSFWTTYSELLDQFKEHTKNMTTEEVFSLLVDPTASVPITKTADETKAAEVTSPEKNEAPAEPEANTSVSEAEPETN